MTTLMRSALLIVIAAATSACGDDQVSGPGSGDAGLTLSRAAAPPGAVVGMSGLPSSVAPETHWVEVGGERSPLILEGGNASFVVPAFLDEAAMWPAPPAGAQDVEVRSASGVAARAPAALTVQALQPADGTTGALVHALLGIGPTLSAAAYAMPSGTGESRRFLIAIGGGLHSLTAAPDVALEAALSELEATPGQLRLLDALLASSGTAGRIQRFASTLLTVVRGLGTDVNNAAPNTHSNNLASSIAIDLLSDEMLSQLMQLAVYLKQNTDFQSELGADLSTVLSLGSILGINADKAAPVGKLLKAVAVTSSLQALVVNTYVVSALPSRLDSLTVQLAADTIAPDAVTNATVRVFASNEPDAVSLGDYLSVFRKVASLFAQGDYFEKAANYLIGKSSDLLTWIADNDESFEYDTDIVDLWSMPDVSFEATIEKRELVVLKTADANVVAPEETDVNWVATATDSGKTTVTVEPSTGPANIPILMEWFADYISENSGSASDLVLGSFGEDIVASTPTDVWVMPSKEEILFTFDDNLEGWSKGTTSSGGWGTAQWQRWCGADRDKGCVKLDGTGGGGAPNAWIHREIDIPSSATTLSFITSAHNRAGSNSDYRVRLIDANGVVTTLKNWTNTSGSAPDLTWIPVSISISAWAGQSVTLYFEGRDNGPGSHEQRYYDDISIR